MPSSAAPTPTPSSATPDPDGSAESGNGRPVTIANPLGNTVRVELDAAGLPIAITDLRGATTRYRRDVHGRVVEITDPVGGVTTLRWAPDGSLASRTTADGATEHWKRDLQGNLIEHADPSGRAMRLEYGPFDKPVAQPLPDGRRLEFGYDAQIRLTTVTNPQGLVAVRLRRRGAPGLRSRFRRPRRSLRLRCGRATGLPHQRSRPNDHLCPRRLGPSGADTVSRGHYHFRLRPGGTSSASGQSRRGSASGTRRAGPGHGGDLQRPRGDLDARRGRQPDPPDLLLRHRQRMGLRPCGSAAEPAGGRSDDHVRTRPGRLGDPPPDRHRSRPRPAVGRRSPTNLAGALGRSGLSWGTAPAAAAPYLRLPPRRPADRRHRSAVRRPELRPGRQRPDHRRPRARLERTVRL